MTFFRYFAHFQAKPSALYLRPLNRVLSALSLTGISLICFVPALAHSDESSGKSERIVACPMNYAPVCATRTRPDGEPVYKIYSNLCQASVDEAVIADTAFCAGTEEDPLPLPDARTYRIACSFSSATNVFTRDDRTHRHPHIYLAPIRGSDAMVVLARTESLMQGDSHVLYLGGATPETDAKGGKRYTLYDNEGRLRLFLRHSGVPREGNLYDAHSLYSGGDLTELTVAGQGVCREGTWIF